MSADSPATTEEKKSRVPQWVAFALAGMVGSGGVSAMSASTILFLQDFFYSKESGIALESRVTKVESAIERIPEQVDQKLQTINREINIVFNKIEQKLEKLPERYHLTDGWTVHDQNRYDLKVEKRFDQLDQRLRAVELKSK